MEDAAEPTFDAILSIPDVRFEYSMLVSGWSWLMLHQSNPQLIEDTGTALSGVAILEASLMHARSLHEFFGEPRRFNTDVRASDFVPGFNSEVFPSDFVDDINRWAQHLTT